MAERGRWGVDGGESAGGRLSGGLRWCQSEVAESGVRGFDGGESAGGSLVLRWAAGWRVKRQKDVLWWWSGGLLGC